MKSLSLHLNSVIAFLISNDGIIPVDGERYLNTFVYKEIDVKTLKSGKIHTVVKFD